MDVTLTLLDEVNCLISGMQDKDLKRLSDKFAFHAPGYFFNPKYQYTSWDGKIRFVKLNGATFVNLLQEIIPELMEMDYNIAIMTRE